MSYQPVYREGDVIRMLTGSRWVIDAIRRGSRDSFDYILKRGTQFKSVKIEYIRHHIDTAFRDGVQIYPEAQP